MRTLREAKEKIEEIKEGAKKALEQVQKEMKKSSLTRQVELSAQALHLQGRVSMAEEVLVMLGTVKAECDDSIKLTQEAWNTMNYIKERVDANIEEIIANIKCEYDTKIERICDPYREGEIMQAHMKISPICLTPLSVDFNIGMQYEKKEKENG